jgi:hypothetical protein
MLRPEGSERFLRVENPFIHHSTRFLPNMDASWPAMSERFLRVE